MLHLPKSFVLHRFFRKPVQRAEIGVDRNVCDSCIADIGALVGDNVKEG